MNRSIAILLLLSLSFLVVFVEPKPVRAQPLEAELPVPGSYESETMTRGPLHEAFAEQVNYDAQPGIIIRKPAPEPIEEIPPDVRPEGNNIEWIPGYWAWDDEREDFLWVSGVWRDVPPDRRWMPGYWAQVDEGYQWIAGFWNLGNVNQVEYLPYPPESLELGPTSPLPSVSHYWVSGCWQYQNQRYLWQPGFWSSYREDWVWTPAHFIWTPRGAIYIRGYWDYPLERRGVLFAPVYFPHYANYQSRYRYSPSVVIDLNHLLYHLFVQPGHHHYYWGDYYGDRYRRSGYQANFAFHGRGGYDPLFNYYNTQQRRQGIDYSSRLRDWHNSQEQHQDRRPPRSWNQQQALTARVGYNSQSNRQLLAQPLRDAIKDSHSDMRFRKVDNNQRLALGHRSTELRELSQHRNSNEARSRTIARSTGALAERPNNGRTATTLQSPRGVGRDTGFGGRVNFEHSESRQNGSSGARTTRSIERTTPDRAASTQQSARAQQLERSGLLNRARIRLDGDRAPQTSPHVVARPETAPKQTVPQPSRNPQNHTRSTVVPSAQPKFRLELPKADNQQRSPRQIEMLSRQPSSRPSFSSRRPDDNSPRIQSVPHLQPKPEISRQMNYRRQDNASTAPFVPRAKSTGPAAKKTPNFQLPKSQGRTDASRSSRSNVQNVRSSNHSQRSAPKSRGRDDNGRSKR